MTDSLPSWASKSVKPQTGPAGGAGLPSWAGTKPAAQQDAGAVVVSAGSSHGPDFLHRFVNGAKDAAIHSPGGIYALGKGLVLDEADLLRGKQGNRTTDALIGQAKRTVTELKHPTRGPFNTTLDALALLSGGAGAVARAGAAGKVLAEGGTIGKAAKTLAVRPNPGVRSFEHQGVKVEKSGSGNAAIRAAHKAVIDPLLNKYPDVPVIGAAAKVSKSVAREARQEKNLRGATQGTFVAKAKQAGLLKRQGKPGRGIAKYTADALARQHALRVVAEAVPIDERVATHEGYLNRGYNPSASKDPAVAEASRRQFESGHQEQVKLNGLASKYVHNVKDFRDGRNGELVPRIKPEHRDLIEAYQWAKRTTGSREELLQLIDKLDESAIAGRKAAPAREFFGQGDAFTGGEARIPTVPGFKEPRTKAAMPEMGSQGAVNLPQTPGSLRHPYEGKAYKGGKIRNDVVNLITESAQEAQRYWTLVHVTDRIKPAIHDLPTDMKHDIPIKVEALPGQSSMKEARAIVEASHSDPSKLAAMSHAYESVRERAFPNLSAADAHTLNQQAIAAGDLPGYKFVDSRLLAGLNKRNPLIGWYDHKILRGSLQVADGINNASKLAILYLKPAYIVPNLLGNTALVLTQQGFAAPKNLINAAKINAAVDKHTVSLVDASIGEGMTTSLGGAGGIAGKAANFAAGKYGKLVDLVPRRAAFLYEAGKEGFNSKNLHKLFDQENRAVLSRVTERANSAMIDYGDLGPIEQSIVRRVIFFYPWVKGASKWTVRFAAEHPIQAAAAAQAGVVGKEQQAAALGTGLPSWAQGLVAVGKKHGLPTTINPASISVLSTLPQILQSVVSGKASDNVPPAIGLALGYKHPLGALEDQGRGLPQAPVLDALLQKLGVDSHLARPSKTYPYERDPLEALKIWLGGSGVVPKATSPDALARSGFYEKYPPRH